MKRAGRDEVCVDLALRGLGLVREADILAFDLDKVGRQDHHARAAGPVLGVERLLRQHLRQDTALVDTCDSDPYDSDAAVGTCLPWGDCQLALAQPAPSLSPLSLLTASFSARSGLSPFPKIDSTKSRLHTMEPGTRKRTWNEYVYKSGFVQACACLCVF